MCVVSILEELIVVKTLTLDAKKSININQIYVIFCFQQIFREDNAKLSNLFTRHDRILYVGASRRDLVLIFA